MAVSKKRLNKISRQRLSTRDSLWSHVDEKELWLRKNADGWMSLPRAFPLICRIADKLAPKGKPVSQTYLELWCRNYDDAFVIASRPREMAYFSGFSGERAEHTWSTRIRTLQEFRFIDVKPGTSGRNNYVLLLNPYYAIRVQHEKGLVSEQDFNALTARAIDIGADDMDDTLPQSVKTAICEKSN